MDDDPALLALFMVGVMLAISLLMLLAIWLR
jgi:hypothetical protein